MFAPEHAAYVAFGFVSLVLLLLPLPWHWRVRNTGTLLIIFWLFLGNLNNIINAIIFRDTADNIAQRWCDFSGALAYIYGPGYTAAMLCLLRRLEAIASTRQVMYSDRDRRRDLYIDLSIGLGIPIIMVPLHYVVQPYRMDVIQGFGCLAPYYPSVAGLFLVQLWQIGLSLACFIYASFALRWFIIRRTQFNAILQSSGSGLNRAKYLRLMLLAATELFLSFPLALYVFITNTKSNPYQPFNWDAVHADWNVTGSYTPDMLGLSTIAATHITRWFALVACWIFFAFFGLTPESRAYYSVCYNAVLVACRLRKPKSPMAPLHTSSQVPSSRITPRHHSPHSFGTLSEAEKGWSPSESKDATGSYGMTDYTTSVPGTPHTPASFGEEAQSPRPYVPLSHIQVTSERIQYS